MCLAPLKILTDLVGLSVGALDGLAEGCVLGEADGCLIGEFDGRLLGEADGYKMIVWDCFWIGWYNKKTNN